MIRRAIRAVALARRLVADSKDGRDRRAFERLSRSSASTLAWAADAAERAAHQPDADAALAALRRAVEVYARDRRLGGDPPERVVVTLKAAVRDVPADGMLDEDRPFLMNVVVQWGIEEYYRCA
jgi:hypothetical protein